MTLCSLNGVIVPLSEARIDPLDRGFLFGDSVYEVIRVVDGVALFVEPHLRRLRRSLEVTLIAEPRGLAEAIGELLSAATPIGSGSIYVQVSRGAGPRRHLPPEGMRPTVLILAEEHELPPLPGPPMDVITAPDWRWRRCDVKSTSLMATVLGKLRARDRGGEEVVFVADGEVREGGSTSLIVRREDHWEVHPKNSSVLPGVTVELLAELAEDLGQRVVERSPRLAERGSWQEVVACGTLTGVRPVVSWDGDPVGSGSAGEWTKGLAAAYGERERAEIESARGASRSSVP